MVQRNLFADSCDEVENTNRDKELKGRDAHL